MTRMGWERRHVDRGQRGVRFVWADTYARCCAGRVLSPPEQGAHNKELPVPSIPLSVSPLSNKANHIVCVTRTPTLF